jgi:CRISPR-associated protein Csd1
MLLHRLVEYANAQAGGIPPHHRERMFNWQLELRGDGSLASRVLTPLVAADPKAKGRGVIRATPSTVRTVGVSANLAADDVQYVLGWADGDVKPARVAQCHEVFVDLVTRWAESPEGSADPVAQAVRAFYRGGRLAEVVREPEFTSKQGVVIAVDGRPAYLAKSVVPFWNAEVARRKGGDTQGLCLVCGTVGPLLETVPGKVRAALVPGATNDAALVSINERVFGYDLTTQLTQTPLCMACGEAFSAGLRDVLESRHVISYGDQDSRLAWWVTQPAEFDAMQVMTEADPAEVEHLLTVIRSGIAGRDGPGIEDPARFCSVSIGGNVARVMVRDWVEMPLADLNRNAIAWFDDHEIEPRRSDGRRHFPLFHLLLVTGRWLAGTKRYADIGRRGADRPPTAQRDLLRAAMRGVPVPPSLLVHLVHRIRSDGRLDDPRAALIRLCLTRTPLTKGKPMPGLDPSNTDPAYLAGRAFAELEQIQYDASGGTLNTSYGDRYFSGAVANPRAALVHGRRDANAWLKKLRRTYPGAAVNHERRLDELFDLMDPAVGIPARPTITQQATFLLGYHQQRAQHFASIRARKAGAGGEDSTASTDTDTDIVTATEESA